MSKGSVKIEEGKIIVGLDVNEDGENSLTLKVNINETISEALHKAKKGEETTIDLTGKKVELKFGIGGMKLVVDTDQDGEPSIELDLSLMEAFEEAGDAF